MHEQVIGSICQDYSGAADVAYHQGDWRAREQAAKEAAYAAQLASLAANRREKALEAALRTFGGTDGPNSVLEAARAYEAYLKGE